MLASQTNNKIPDDPDYIKNALHLDKKPDIKLLIERGFLVYEQTDSDALASCEHNAMLETETETETDIRANATAFDAFWSAWPKKVDKVKAEKAWRRLTVKDQKSAMADFPNRYAQTEKRFIPNPTTYIHGKRWEDELPNPAPMQEVWE